jgi:hypothetical protein
VLLLWKGKVTALRFVIGLAYLIFSILILLFVSRNIEAGKRKKARNSKQVRGKISEQKHKSAGERVSKE